MQKIKFYKKFNRIENKQLAIFSLILSIVSALNIVGNIILKLPIELNVLLVVAIFFHTTIYYLCKNDKLTEKQKYYYFNLLSFCLIFIWIFNGGLDSSTPTYFLIYFSAGVLSVSSKYLLKYVVFFCSICLICLYIEFFSKELIQAYPNQTAKTFDLLLTFILGIVVLLSLLLSYKKIFLHEQKALLNKTLRIQAFTEELTEAKNIALNAVKAKSNFLSNMSHEIRTPLNGIIGTIDLLKTTNIDAEQKVLLNNLAFSSHVLIELVNDILDISKMEASKLTLKNKSFNLCQTLETLEALANTLIKDKDILIRFHIPDHTPKQIISDESKIRQILINLLSNAAKFTIKGSIDVFIDYSTESKELEIKVKDTGIGIKDDNFSKLFLPFSQIDNNINNPSGGVGLGLLICSKLTELLNGKISFKSEYGNGTIFCIKFPVELDDNLREITIADVKPSEVLKNLSNMDILIVEDNQINQIIMSKMLQSFDCYYSIANHGDEALELVKNQNFDIILMDVRMPVKDGITATKEIIEYFNITGGKCPIIIGCTANAMTEDKEECLNAGMVDLVIKPVKLEVLKETLQKYAL